MIVIVSNGNRREDGSLATIDELLGVMAREPLCPSFLDLRDSEYERPYEGAAKVGVRNPEWGYDSQNSVPEFIDGPPIYPESQDAVRFFGNFENLSHAFTIDTDEPELIDRMRAAIDTNLAGVMP
ncbi:MAG TPA: hypothetical protein VGE09_11335 [Pseudoxanthomonas sp.]